ncbi:MAG: hypothetical protein BA867_04665 [Desulfobacterales bacterium S5133MH16]|nr:MAG: hypothetical protein BA867_04665 [Desulfobacterales bacterium S5133MH16]
MSACSRLFTKRILIITDLGEEAFYTDNQARLSYRFEISIIILLMQKAYNINKLNKKATKCEAKSDP